MEHGDGLHAQSHDLHHLVQPGCACLCPPHTLLDLGSVFGVVFTGLNIQRVKTSARLNAGLAIAIGVVIAVFFVAAARYVFGVPHETYGFYPRPFYDRAMWDLKALLGGTSIAVLTYIGFDSISTLSEEVENPRRNILLATVLTCLVIGILSVLESYAAQLVWPASQPFPNEDTAFLSIGQRGVGAIVRGGRVHAARGKLRFGHGSTTRSRQTALWYGA